MLLPLAAQVPEARLLRRKIKIDTRALPCHHAALKRPSLREGRLIPAPVKAKTAGCAEGTTPSLDCECYEELLP